MIYPRCAQTFLSFIKSREPYLDTFFKLGMPKAWDCTLHDGVQSLAFEEQAQFKIADKSKMLFENIARHKPYAVDLGSFTSAKLLPVMANNIKFFKKTQEDYTKIGLKKPNAYIHIFNTAQLDYLVNHDLFSYISMSSSFSEEFQHHNTKFSRETMKRNIFNIVKELDYFCYNREVITMPYPKVKLSLNCFNHCPFEGKIDDLLITDTIVEFYHKVKPDTIVLKDTCGLLTQQDMERILDKCFSQGVKPKRLSMHYHILPSYPMEKAENQVSSLINHALDMGITTFEVSSLKTGGCPHRLSSAAPQNLTYELFYKTLVDRILLDVTKDVVSQYPKE